MEKKAPRGRLWKVMGSEQFLRGMWVYFTLERAGARKHLAVKRSADADCSLQTMRRACLAMKSCNWEDFKEDCRKAL